MVFEIYINGWATGEVYTSKIAADDAADGWRGLHIGKVRVKEHSRRPW